MTDEPNLDAFAYLWNPPGIWQLHASHHNLVRLTISFEGDRPSVRELASLRSLVTAFRDVSPRTLKELIGTRRELALGEFFVIEAARLSRHAATLGLRVVAENMTRTSYIPIERLSQHALIIEDDDLAQLVYERMIAEGVEIIHTEEC